LVLTGKKVTEALPLYRLQSGDCKQLAKTLSCHQLIACDSAFSLAMIAGFTAARSGNAV
jgi:hypothetical protein